MGTRNSTLVKINNEFKVAQYGQWDGYPEGQGLTILKTLRNCNHNELKEKCSKITQIENEKYKNLWVECGADPNDSWFSMDVSNRFKEKYPYLQRDCGGEILEHILSGVCKEVNLDVDFAQNDTISCEWAYIVDFDKNVLECYSGTIMPHNLVASFDLNNLPTENQFLAKFQRQEEE